MHQWTVTGNSAECQGCSYKIVPDVSGEAKGGSMHVPSEKTIYVDRPEVSIEDAEFFIKVWGVVCND